MQIPAWHHTLWSSLEGPAKGNNQTSSVYYYPLLAVWHWKAFTERVFFGAQL